MRIGIIKSVLFVIVFCFISCDLLSRKENEIVSILKESRISLKHQDNKWESDNELLRIFMNKAVVGLGEATHGSEEFFYLRSQITKYLIYSMDFKVIAIEAGFQECANLNAYITCGAGNVEELVKGLKQWFWQREEMIQFIEWLKSYNKDKKDDEKIEIFGFDMQWRNASAKNIAAFLLEISPSLYRKVEKKMEIIANTENICLPDSIYRTIVELEDILRKNSNDYQQDSLDYKVALHNLQILKQAELFLKDRSEVKIDYERIRDQFMAQNVIKKYDCQPRKIVLWAHNSHISKGQRCGRWGIICDDAMGKILKDRFGEQYFPVGFEFNKGAFWCFYNKEKFRSVFFNESIALSLPYFLLKAEADNCIINFKTVEKNSSIGKMFLNSPINTHSIGTFYLPDDRYNRVRIGNHYESVVFVNESNPFNFIQ